MSAEWIRELEAVCQKLQGPREVLGCHVDHVGVQRIVDDRQAQRRHVQAELVRSSGARREAVQAVTYVFDQRLRVRLARFLDGL